MGYRFRLHRADLPGKPDLIFPRRRAVIFVHGCFWHGHQCVRDEDHRARLEVAGWRTLILWECELNDASGLTDRLRKFLG